MIPHLAAAAAALRYAVPAERRLVFRDASGEIFSVPIAAEQQDRLEAAFNARYVTREEHDLRVNRLITANNKEVDRRRDAEDEAARLRLQLEAMIAQNIAQRRALTERLSAFGQELLERVRGDVTAVLTELQTEVQRNPRFCNPVAAVMSRLVRRKAFNFNRGELDGDPSQSN